MNTLAVDSLLNTPETDRPVWRRLRDHLSHRSSIRQTNVSQIAGPDERIALSLARSFAGNGALEVEDYYDA